MMFHVKLPGGEVVKFNETWPQRRIEWLLASCGFGVGLVYGFSSTMDKLPTYDGQLEILPQWAWAVWLTTCGVIRLLFLFVNGAYRRSPHWRAVGAALGCVAWLTQFFSVVTGPIMGPTVVIWGLFFLFDVHVALSAAGEAGKADVKGKAASQAVPAIVLVGAVSSAVSGGRENDGGNA